MGVLKTVLAFGAGMVTASYAFPKVADSVERIKKDSAEVMKNEMLIKQMCVDQIARWYYDGQLESTIKDVMRQQSMLDQETKNYIGSLKQSVPFWPKVPRSTQIPC